MGDGLGFDLDVLGLGKVNLDAASFFKIIGFLLLEVTTTTTTAAAATVVVVV